MIKAKHLFVSVGIAAVVALVGAFSLTYKGSVSVIYPNPTLTPGAINQNITQANISQNICNPSWSTKSIRPPVSYTNPLKIKQITQYGYSDTNTADYEEDHLISLEIGGSPTDPSNLWPEPYAPKPGAREKDRVENFLHAQICNGKITLEQAQTAIVKDWYLIYQAISDPNAIIPSDTD